MEALAVTEGELVDAVVGGEDEDVARGVQDGRADLADLEMLLDGGQHFGVEGVVEIAGDLLPDVFALYDHGNHLRFGFICLSCGARCFCSMMRARCSLTLTRPVLILRTSAVSAMLNSSTSRRRKISR